MRSFRADPAASQSRTGILLALAALADETTGTVARLFVYVGTLALLVIFALYGLDQLPPAGPTEPTARAASDWIPAGRPQPAFAVASLDPLEKTEPYAILRHPGGGRKDILRWSRQGTSVAELQIYRTGAEFDRSEPPEAELAERMGVAEGGLESAGLLDSKLGTLALMQPVAATSGALPCLGFSKRIADPPLLLSGWSCQGETLPARRAAIACTVNRLTLLSAGNEPRLAQLFARAELKQKGCGPAVAPDWVTATENPRLRGTL